MSSDMAYLLKAQLVAKQKKTVTKSEDCEQCEDLSFENVTDYLQHYREELNLTKFLP